MTKAYEDRRERVFLVGLARSPSELHMAEESLEELAQLAETAGADTIGRVIQVRQTPDPATYIGKGKAREIVESAQALHADAIIFDDELAPAQGRNLEDLAGVNPLAESAMKIIDRTGLILDVFSQHAHSAEGKLQVELAQINYMVPRLRGWGDVMSRIGGGTGGPGIGVRGPGETKLEVDRRRIKRRLTQVRQELADVERTRAVKRAGRLRAGAPQISIVGYTNAGKSTLLNALTGAEVLVEDKLFSTLDPTARKLALPDGRQTVIMDTVGFVKKLPHQLVEAFRSTLEETIHADLLLHVVDASHTEPDAQIEAVERVLMQIQADRIPKILALNKADQIDVDTRARVKRMFPDGVFVSALRSEGLDELLDVISARLSLTRTSAEFLIPFDRSDVRSLLHEQAEVVEEDSSEAGVTMLVRASPSVLSRFSQFLSVDRSA